MLHPVQITFRGMEPSEAVERRIQTKMQDLERFGEQLVSCHITVEQPHRHHQTGNKFLVHMDLRVRSGHLAVNRDHTDNKAHDDVYVALRDAFDAAIRQLESYVRKQRGEVKRHGEGAGEAAG